MRSRDVYSVYSLPGRNESRGSEAAEAFSRHCAVTVGGIAARQGFAVPAWALPPTARNVLLRASEATVRYGRRAARAALVGSRLRHKFALVMIRTMDDSNARTSAMPSRRRRLGGLLWAALVLAAPGGVSGPGGATAFDASSLSGWREIGSAGWRLDGGDLVADAGGGDTLLVTRAEFGDFVLSLRFHIGADTNSGVFVRCADSERITAFSCYEINIWDSHPRQEFRTGAIVNEVFPPLARVDTVGKWNTLRIEAHGGTVRVSVNGVTTAVLEDAARRSGFVALQRFGTGAVRFADLVMEGVGRSARVEDRRAPAARPGDQ